MTTEETLPPNFTKLDTALRSIGYSFEVAVADIIDNSIDAKARNVLVRLIMRDKGRLDLAIWDDGVGMDAKTLKEAMRFGSDVSSEVERLGKFGLGLKLASLSQAREVKVFSAHAGKISGRAWLEHGISSGFRSTVFDATECRKEIAKLVPDKPLKNHGTLVSWSHLYRVSGNQKNPEEHAQKLLRRLEHHLSISFHRLLSGRPRKIAIRVDIFDEASESPGIPIDLDPLDPFGYSQSGKTGFPAAMVPTGKYKNRMSILAHIWPPNATAPEYRLPGGSNARQGFYFYRNNRLIQGGGWNGLREAEPHSSLARLEIDISPNLDLDISLDVKKVEVQLPPDLTASIQHAATATGLDLKKYLSVADEVYRKRKVVDSDLPLIPSTGLPSDLVRFLHGELRHESTAKHRDLKISWKELSRTTFFEIDRDAGSLFINRAFRKALLNGSSASSSDAPVLKSLLFFALDEALASERTGPRIKKRLHLLNRVLVRAVKYQRNGQ